VGGPQYCWQSLMYGVIILLVALLLYLYRILVQDRRPAAQIAKP
jgi:hypothetical protein